MVCSNCGKELPDGTQFCEACGAPTDSPVGLKVSKEDIKNAEKKQKEKERQIAKEARSVAAKKQREKEREVFAANKVMPNTELKVDFSNYVKNLRKDFNSGLAFIGSLLLYLAPFLNWIWEKLFDVKKKASLYELGLKGDKYDMDSRILYMDEKRMLVLGIVILVVGLVMLAMSAADYIKVLRPYSSNIVFRILPIVILAVVLVVILKNDAYQNALDAIEKNNELAKQIGSKSNYSGGIGVGPIVYGAGLVVYTIGTIRDLIQRHA